MSDDLIKRLRMRDKNKHGYFGNPLFNRDGPEAADRIKQLAATCEQLEREVERFTTASAVEIASSNNRVTEYMFHWEGRALDAEAKLATAMEALREQSCNCSSNCDWEHDDVCPSWTARTVLAELEK